MLKYITLLSQLKRQRKATQLQHKLTPQQPAWASEKHLLMTTKYSGIDNNNNNNDTKNNNNINNKIIGFRNLRLTFIDHN